MYERECKYCQAAFVSDKPLASVCDQCKIDQVAKWERKPYMVVKSPLDNTGRPEYPLWARFSAMEVRETLRLKNFPIGLVLQARGANYQVIGKKLRKINE